MSERPVLYYERFCSFCGKPPGEVGRLIVGPGQSICAECVALCNEILADRRGITRVKNFAAILREGAPNN